MCVFLCVCACVCVYLCACARVRRFYEDNYPASFKEQLELFAGHGIFVSPHGAGLMNAMFLAPFSSVIEIFPYHFDHNIYSTVSATAGLGYYPVHTYNGSHMWANYKVRRSAVCVCVCVRVCVRVCVCVREREI